MSTPAGPAPAHRAAAAETSAGSVAFERFAGACGGLAALVGLLYAVSFVVLRHDALAAGSLLLGGLLATAVLTAYYLRLRVVDEGFALWALLLGLGGAFGAAIHGGYDLAIALSPPATARADLPSAVDPRGLLTFGAAGLSALTNAWLLARAGGYPRGLWLVGAALGVLLLLLYAARLPGLPATHPLVLAPALLTGFLAHPAWYAWLGHLLFYGQARTHAPAAAR